MLRCIVQRCLVQIITDNERERQLTISSEFFFLYWQVYERRVEEANIHERRDGDSILEMSSCFLFTTSFS